MGTHRACGSMCGAYTDSSQEESVLDSFFSAWHGIDSLKRRKPQLRKCFCTILVKEVLYIIFLISDCWGRAQTIVVSDLPGKVVLSYIRKEVKQEWEKSSKQHPSMVSVSAHISRFLPCLSPHPDVIWWWMVIWKYKLNKPFLPWHVFWSWSLTAANRNSD